MVRQALVFGPVLRRDGDRHARFQSDVDQLKVDPLAVDVNRSFLAGANHSIVNRPPELVGALGDATLAVTAKRDTVYLGAAFQQLMESISAILGVVLRRQTIDAVVHIWAITKFVRVGPKGQLKVQSAHRRLVYNIAEHFQVAVAFLVGQPDGLHVVTRHREQEWIGEIEV